MNCKISSISCTFSIETKGFTSSICLGLSELCQSIRFSRCCLLIVLPRWVDEGDSFMVMSLKWFYKISNLLVRCLDWLMRVSGLKSLMFSKKRVLVSLMLW
ncbi:hypothetical protein Dimus_034059 [Dionaea muscipula]